MNDMIYDALVDLKQSIDKQNELQQQTVGAMQALTEMTAHAIDAIKDLTEALQEDE